MSDGDDRRSHLLGRPGSRRRRAIARLRERAPVPALPLGPNASAAMVRAFAERAGDAVDAMASKLLATDDGAAQLAFIVEACAQKHGDDEVMAVVLRRNLWLDGTFLRIIEPLLRGETEPRLDDATLLAGRRTLLRLLAEVAEPSAPPPAEDDDEAWWDALRQRGADLPLDALEPLLLGQAPRDDLAAFLVGSYTLFLQTFLLRSTARALPRLMDSARDARAPALDAGTDEDSEPT